MKKIIFPLLILIESIILITFVILHNKNNIIGRQGVYDFHLDNGCKGQIFFDNTSKNNFCGLYCVDKKNNYSSVIFDDQLWTINYNNNNISATKYENDNGSFVVFANNFEGKNIIYAIDFSESPQVIKDEDFYNKGIVFRPEEPVK